MAKICPNCGKETDSKFCPDCGTDLSTIPSIETEVISDTSKEISSDVNSGEVDASTPLNKSVKKKSALSMGNSGNKGKKKPIALIVLAVLVVFGLFGCLGGGGSSNNDSSLSDDNEAIETSQVEETPEIEEEPIVTDVKSKVYGIATKTRHTAIIIISFFLEDFFEDPWISS